MKRITLLLTGIMLIALLSCQKDNNDMAGKLEVHLSSVARIENFTLYQPLISPAENVNLAIDMEWDNPKVRNNVKIYTTDKLLNGTYILRTKVRRSIGSGVYEESDELVSTFQVFPGKTTTVELFYQ